MLSEVSKARCFSFFTYTLVFGHPTFSAFPFNFCSLLDCASLDFSCSSSRCCCIPPCCEKKKEKKQFSISALVFVCLSSIKLEIAIVRAQP